MSQVSKFGLINMKNTFFFYLASCQSEYAITVAYDQDFVSIRREVVSFSLEGNSLRENFLMGLFP